MAVTNMGMGVQDYVKELAKLLLAHGDDKDSEGYRQLEDYVLQAVRYFLSPSHPPPSESHSPQNLSP